MHKGFTLIEILVVLLIISIVTGVALLSFSPNRKQELANVANALAESISLAQEEAMLRPAILGLFIRPEAFQFAILKQDNKKKQWVWSEDKLLARHSVPAPIQLTLRLTEKASSVTTSSNVPQIIISTNGDMPAFHIYIARAGEAPRYVVQSDGNGEVRDEPLP